MGGWKGSIKAYRTGAAGSISYWTGPAANRFAAGAANIACLLLTDQGISFRGFCDGAKTAEFGEGKFMRQRLRPALSPGFARPFDTCVSLLQASAGWVHLLIKCEFGK